MGAIYTVKMPDIGEGVVEGEVIQWIKSVNDPVGQDEPVIVLMTDKATVELTAPYPGKIAKHYYEAGQIAIKDKPLYDIELAAGVAAIGKPEAAPKRKEVEEAAPPVKKTAMRKSEQGPKIQTVEKALALPSTRGIAKKLGIDINAIKGTGRDGRVSIEDLKNYIAAKPSRNATPPLAQEGFEGDEVLTLTGIKGLMAKSMAESHANIPQFSYFEQVEVSRLIQLRSRLKDIGAQEGTHVTFMPFLIRALSLTIKKFPEINSTIDMEKNQLTIHHKQNIGIATTTPMGLIVPVLKNVEDMSLTDLIRKFEELKTKAQSGKLQPSDMKGGTISISNFGVLGGGGLWATPVIPFPEVAILAVARIHKQPAVKNNKLEVMSMLNLSWSFDHRVIDGDMAASCSHYFSSIIHNPASLL